MLLAMKINDLILIKLTVNNLKTHHRLINYLLTAIEHRINHQY